MANVISKDDMRRFARLGAMKRLEDIRREEAAIRAAFPELFSVARPAKAAGTTPAKTAVTRKRSKMSPAMRREVSERMKKYWAARRKSKNG